MTRDFIIAGDRLIKRSSITSVDTSKMETELIATIHHWEGETEVQGIQAIEAIMLLRPSVLEGRRFRWKKRAWIMHNLVGHPLMQLLALAGFYDAAMFVHDVTVPKPTGASESLEAWRKKRMEALESLEKATEEEFRKAVADSETWRFPIREYSGIIPEGKHPGAFGFRRKHHTHEGVDIYVSTGTEVQAVENGQVVFVGPFTGPSVGTPWWHETSCVMIRGRSGVVNYGELQPSVVIGQLVEVGQVLGTILQVLREDSAKLFLPDFGDQPKPLSMLHLELYEPDVTEPVEWLPDTERPVGLLDPTEFLKGAR